MLADEDSPAFFPGLFEVAAACWAATDKATEENHNGVGRVFYSASTMLCVPHSLALHGPGLGAQAGEARLRDVVVGGGGFTRFRRATETPFNMVLEARP